MARAAVLSLGGGQLEAWLQGQGEAAYRARQVRQWVMQRRVGEFDAMTDLPASLRTALDGAFTVLGSTIEWDDRAAGDTRKLLIRLEDGHAIECVLMSEAGRHTVCISTQVGCGMACAFCASGLEGVVRNLRSHEIIEQFLHAQRLLDAEAERITHAVIMGMGEPLANLDALLEGLEVVCGPIGLGLSRRHVTISTVGLPQRIRQLADVARGYHLAISLHAPNDELRNQLVPPNARIGMDAVLEAGDYFAERTGRQVTYEYVLLRGVNDGLEHARELAGRLGSRQVHINLIPYNPVAGLAFATPQAESVQRFAQSLRRAGFSVKVRKTKGRKIDAACGQLRLVHLPTRGTRVDHGHAR